MTQQRIPGSEISGLASYINDELFEPWKKNRHTLELKWQQNLDAFNAEPNTAWKTGEAEGWRSDTVHPIVKMKILSAFSIVADMMLQNGSLPFNLIPSPMDRIILEDLDDMEREQIEDSISDMVELIRQQQLDCKGDREMLKCIFSGALYGEANAKGYVQAITRNQFKPVSFAPPGLRDPGGKYTRHIQEQVSKNSPGWEYLSVWNIFRDMEIDDIQSSVGIIHRDFTSPFEMRQKIGGPFWLPESIEEAITRAKEPGASASGEDSTGVIPGRRKLQHRHQTIERKEFWGRVPVDVVQQFEEDIMWAKNGKALTFADGGSEFVRDGNEVEIMATLADDHIVRYTPMPPNERPFWRCVWEIKLDHHEAQGVADNIECIRKVLTGLVRAYEDNKRLSANVIFATKSDYLEPGALDKWYPGKRIEVSEEVDDVRKALQQVIVQDVGASILEGISVFERIGDETSQMPKIMQGEVAEKKQPDTAFELNQLLTNAGKYIGGVVKNYDELIENIVNFFFTYNMSDPSVQYGKGNYIAKALGFSTFNDMVVKLQKLMQALQIITSHEALLGEAKVRELLEEIFKALGIDPSNMLKTMEEKQAEFQQQMEMAAMQEAKARKFMGEQIQVDEAKEAAKHDRLLDLEGVRQEGKLDAIKTEGMMDVMVESVKEGGKDAG